NPRLLGAIRASMAASAGLLLAANVPMARDALTGGFLAAVAVVSFGVFSFTRIDSVWVILAAAAVGLAGAAFIH
ncbi:MAG: chromate transporter, partial [Gemmatimonadales bacterium]